MRIYKRGRFYHYEFQYRGKPYRASTHCANQRDAQDIANAARMRVISGEAGIDTTKQIVPTFREFRSTFLEWVNIELDNERSRKFYTVCFDSLLQHENLASTPLDHIDERVVDGLKKWARTQLNRDGEPVSKAWVNRQLQTLKKALRYARDILKLIEKVPVIKMLPGEKNRDYIFTDDDFKRWLGFCPEPLRSASVLARWSGISRTEIVALQKDSVEVLDACGRRRILW